MHFTYTIASETGRMRQEMARLLAGEENVGLCHCPFPSSTASVAPRAVIGGLAFGYCFWQAGTIFPLQRTLATAGTATPTDPLASLPPPAPPTSFDSWLGALVGRIGIVGVTASAVLSGATVICRTPSSIHR